MSDTTLEATEPDEATESDQTLAEVDAEVEAARRPRRLRALWYTLAFTVGALLAVFVFSWTLTTGSFDGLLYDHLDRTSSVPASMPLLLGLALVGLVVVVLARRRRDRSTLAALRIPLLGAAVAVVPSLAFIFLTQRYMGDIIPLLVLGALAGFFAFVAWASRRRGWMRIPVVLAGVALLALATFSALANYGMARDWQREHVPPDQIFPEDRQWR